MVAAERRAALAKAFALDQDRAVVPRRDRVIVTVLIGVGLAIQIALVFAPLRSVPGGAESDFTRYAGPLRPSMVTSLGISVVIGVVLVVLVLTGVAPRIVAWVMVYIGLRTILYEIPAVMFDRGVVRMSGATDELLWLRAMLGTIGGAVLVGAGWFVLSRMREGAVGVARADRFAMPDPPPP
jgi:hypothetical protein